MKSKMVRREVRAMLHHIGKGKDILNRIPFASGIRTRTDKWDLVELKSLFIAKDKAYHVKRQTTEKANVGQLHI